MQTSICYGNLLRKTRTAPSQRRLGRTDAAGCKSSRSARAGNRRFVQLSAASTHANAPHKTDLLWGTLRIRSPPHVDQDRGVLGAHDDRALVVRDLALRAALASAAKLWYNKALHTVSIQ